MNQAHVQICWKRVGCAARINVSGVMNGTYCNVHFCGARSAPYENCKISLYGFERLLS